MVEADENRRWEQPRGWADGEVEKRSKSAVALLHVQTCCDAVYAHVVHEEVSSPGRPHPCRVSPRTAGQHVILAQKHPRLGQRGGFQGFLLFRRGDRARSEYQRYHFNLAPLLRWLAFAKAARSLLRDCQLDG